MALWKPFVAMVCRLLLIALLACPTQAQAQDYIYPVIEEESLFIDYKWLPYIVGIPTKKQVNSLTDHVIEIMKQEKDNRCHEIDFNLRLLVFQNFVIYQYMLNKQNRYFTERLALKYAHYLAIILKESSGNPLNVTAMSGRSLMSPNAEVNLKRWKNIQQSMKKKKLKFTSQTNFGLTQLSVDRLYVAFKLNNNSFLARKYNHVPPPKDKLNTAIAIRRLIWFYQDISQGRLNQHEQPISQQVTDNNALTKRHKKGLEMALIYCGTKLLFKKASAAHDNDTGLTFQKAMASIAYCKLGSSQTGYGQSSATHQCFADWVTLCPALNFNIALVTPLSYFQTRKAHPVCLETFKRLMIKKPQ
jgi:hypothetical protein